MTTLEELVQRMRCSKCGAGGAVVVAVPILRPRGVPQTPYRIVVLALASSREAEAEIAAAGPAPHVPMWAAKRSCEFMQCYVCTLLDTMVRNQVRLNHLLFQKSPPLGKLRLCSGMDIRLKETVDSCN
jgi:hypothetical protein